MEINGNPGGIAFPIDRVNTGNNFFGTNGANNTAVRMGTAGFSRIFMQNNTGATAGFIGVGRNFTAPQSLLHVNGVAYNTGNLFRTNGPAGRLNQWQLFTGATEKFRLYVPAGTSNVLYNAVQNNGNMQSQTGGITRVFIQNNTGVTAGFVGVGNNVTNPGNSLEIKSIIASSGTVNGHPNAGPSIGSPTGASGLRFTNLRSSSVPEANLSSGVLSVNTDGDVILVPGGITSADNGIFISATGAAQLGGSCSIPAGITASHLTSSRVLDLNNNNFQFINGRIGFATGTCTAPRNRVEITGLNANQSGLTFTNLNASSPTISNPGTGLLSVDSNGVVILVSAGAGGIAGPAAANNGVSIQAGVAQLGGACNDSAAIAASKFISHRTIDLNGFHLAFGNGTMGFGTGCVQGARVSIQGSTIQPFDRSGLRFPLLTDTASVQPNNSNKVLSVNSSGDVILVSAVGSGGGICGTNPPTLTNDWEIPLGTSNYVFTGQDAVGSRVGIGTTCNPNAKLSIDAYGTGVNNYGVLSRAQNASYNNWGGYFVGIGGTQPVGIYAFAAGGTGPTGARAALLDGKVQITGFLGLGTYDPQYRIDVQGDINASGSVRSAGIVIGSDQRFKTNIDTINNALGIIKQLNPKTYFFDTANVYGMNFSSQRQYGLIAQQVETILPELISNTVKSAELDSAGNIIHQAITYKALNYNAFIAILMKGMQEQQKTIDSLKKITGLTSNPTKQDSINAALQNQINQLTNNMNSCCNTITNGFGFFKSLKEDTNQTDVELNNSQSIVLEQNVPNPFAEQTTINYFLPDNTVKAQMLFYDARGILIKSVDLVKNGNGTLNVFAQDLTSGIYTYTLVADGNVVESKRMVKQ